MIVTITQTYGDQRKELYDIRSQDHLLKYFLDSFDHDIFSFHNCHKDTIDYFKSKNSSKEYIEYNNINYTDTIKNLINRLKELKCSKIIFLQDDVFSSHQNKDQIDTIISDIKNNNTPLLNLEFNKGNFKKEVQNKMDLVRKIGDVEIWKCFTSFFVENGYYSFDDGPYVLDFDLIDLIYDTNFFQHQDVWSSENYNNNKFKYFNFPRYITNITFLKRYNIVGRNNWNREVELNELRSNFFKNNDLNKK